MHLIIDATTTGFFLEGDKFVPGILFLFFKFLINTLKQRVYIEDLVLVDYFQLYFALA